MTRRAAIIRTIRAHIREIRDAAIRIWWVFVVVVPLVVGGSYFAVDYARAEVDKAQTAAIARDRAQQLRDTAAERARAAREAARDRRTRAQVVRSQNRLICLLKRFVEPQLKSYRNAAKDPTLTPSARRRNDKRISDTKAVLLELVTVPSTYKCPAPKPKGT